MEKLNLERLKKHHWIQTNKWQARHNYMIQNSSLMSCKGNWSKQQQEENEFIGNKEKNKS